MRSTLPTLDGVQRSRLWPSRSAPHPAKTTNASVDNSLLRSRQAAIGHPWLPARAKDAFIDPFDLPSPNDRCLSVAVATDEVTDVFVRENVLLDRPNGRLRLRPARDWGGQRARCLNRGA